MRANPYNSRLIRTRSKLTRLKKEVHTSRRPIHVPMAIRHPPLPAKDLFKFLKPAYPTWSDERAYAHAADLRCPLTTSFKSMARGEAAKVMLVAALAPAPPLVGRS